MTIQQTVLLWYLNVTESLHSATGSVSHISESCHGIQWYWMRGTVAMLIERSNVPLRTINMYHQVPSQFFLISTHTATSDCSSILSLIRSTENDILYVVLQTTPYLYSSWSSSQIDCDNLKYRYINLYFVCECCPECFICFYRSWLHVNCWWLMMRRTEKFVTCVFGYRFHLLPTLYF